MAEILASAAVPVLFGIGIHIKIRMYRWEKAHNIVRDITKEK